MQPWLKRCTLYLGLCIPLLSVSACRRSKPPTANPPAPPASVEAKAPAAPAKVPAPPPALAKVRPEGEFIQLTSQVDEIAVVFESDAEVEYEGAARSIKLGTGDAATKKVKLTSLPLELRSWLGRKLTLYTDAGPGCEATVSGFLKVHWESDPENQTPTEKVYGTQDDDKPSAASPKPSSDGGTMGADAAQAVASDPFEELESKGHGALLGTLSRTGDTKACAGAKFARLSTLPPLRVSAFSAATDAVASRALKLLRKHPDFHAMQERYLSGGHPEEKNTGPWISDADIQVSAAKFGAQSIIMALAKREDGDPEFGFAGNVCLTFIVSGPAKQRVWTDKPFGDCDRNTSLPIAVSDIDADGNPDLLFEIPDYTSSLQGVRWEKF